MLSPILKGVSEETIPEYIMCDVYPYEKKVAKETRRGWKQALEGYEDTDESENQGYESSAEIDLEDAEDN